VITNDELSSHSGAAKCAVREKERKGRRGDPWLIHPQEMLKRAYDGFNVSTSVASLVVNDVEGIIFCPDIP